MDLITIKINNLPQYLQKIGTEVQIIGANNTICDVAKAAGTIEYEVITRLGNRFKRVYE
jgi:alanine racemase